jgi:hypothetical protein
MKERTITSDRYYELRHELAPDFHEDYDFSNAVAYGIIKSIRTSGPQEIELIVSNQQDCGESEDYQVRIGYSSGGKYSRLENHTRG